jgi:hypothetical protein
VDQRKPIEAKARQDAEKPFAQWLADRQKDVKPDFKAWHVVRGHLESQEGTLLTQDREAIVIASGLILLRVETGGGRVRRS